MEKIKIGTEAITKTSVYLAEEDRPYGLILLGQTGMGKTSLMEQFIYQDLRERTNAFIFDPHGELSERLWRICFPFSVSPLFLFCEITGSMSYGFNPLEVNDPNDPLETSRTV